MALKLGVSITSSAVVLVSVLSGCSSEDPGIAEPASSVSKIPTVSSSAVPDENSAAPASRVLEPCELLSASDLAEYGEFSDGEYKELAGARSCSWQLSNRGGVDGFVVALNVRDSQSVDTMNDVGGGVDEYDINGRAVARAANPRFYDCTIGVEVDARSRVDVTVNGLSSTDETCSIAEDVARLVEPRLPEVS